MAKKGGSRLDKKDAQDIAKKLKAEVEKGGSHNHALVKHAGVLVAKFGIRHDKQAKHGHIPPQLFVSENDAVGLARCTVSEAQWIAKMREKGIIPKV